MQSQIVKYYTAGLMPNGSMALKFLVEDPLLIGYGLIGSNQRITSLEIDQEQV